jgi:hypothetical protein
LISTPVSDDAAAGINAVGKAAPNGLGLPKSIDPKTQVNLVFFASDAVSMGKLTSSYNDSPLQVADRERLPMASFADGCCRPELAVPIFGPIIHSNFWTELFITYAPRDWPGFKILDLTPNGGAKLVASLRLNLPFRGIEETQKIYEIIRPALVDLVSKLYEANELEAYLSHVTKTGSRPTRRQPSLDASDSSFDDSSDSSSSSSSSSSTAAKRKKEKKQEKKRLKKQKKKEKKAKREQREGKKRKREDGGVELEKDLESLISSAKSPKKSRKSSEGAQSNNAAATNNPMTPPF